MQFAREFMNQEWPTGWKIQYKKAIIGCSRSFRVTIHDPAHVEYIPELKKYGLNTTMVHPMLIEVTFLDMTGWKYTPFHALIDKQRWSLEPKLKIAAVPSTLSETTQLAVFEARERSHENTEAIFKSDFSSLDKYPAPMQIAVSEALKQGSEQARFILHEKHGSYAFRERVQSCGVWVEYRNYLSDHVLFHIWWNT
jgi:hypothetical protein